MVTTNCRTHTDTLTLAAHTSRHTQRTQRAKARGVVGEGEGKGKGCRGLSIFRDSVSCVCSRVSFVVAPFCLVPCVPCALCPLPAACCLVPYAAAPRCPRTPLCGIRLLFRLCVSGMSFFPAFLPFWSAHMRRLR